MQSRDRLIQRLNLMPQDLLRRQHSDKIQFLTGWLLLLLTVLLPLVSTQLQCRLDVIEQKLINAEPTIKQIRSLERKAEALYYHIDRESKRQQLLNEDSVNPKQNLDQIELAALPGIGLTKITVTDEMLYISGWADTPSSSAMLLERLQVLFGEELRLVSCQYKDNIGLYQFVIEGKIDRT
ncbi:MAG TPA: hypothetical protein VJ036_03405 [bacterium]|jgi:hypothetical protein|nr:hypothetical protein [bacterium]